MTETDQRDCQCSHARTLHPDRNDGACRVPSCDCEQYRPAGKPAAAVPPRPPASAAPAATTNTTLPPAASAQPQHEQLLVAGERSESKRIKALSARIRADLADLRGRLVAEREAAERRRQIEAEREEARRAVVALEKELADARAKLRSSKAPPVASAVRAPGTLPCPDCDETFATAQGVGAHRAHKHGYRAAKAG